MIRQQVVEDGTLKMFADHWVVKLVERVAIALIVFFGYDMYMKVEKLDNNLPVTEKRLADLENYNRSFEQERKELAAKTDAQLSKITDDITDLKISLAEGKGKVDALDLKVDTVSGMVGEVLRQMKLDNSTGEKKEMRYGWR